MLQQKPLFYQPLSVNPAALDVLAEQGQAQAALSAALSLDLFSRLECAKTALALAAEMDLEAQTTARLLEVLAHLGCLTVSPKGYSNTPLAGAYLIPGRFLYLGHRLVEPLAPGSFGFELLRCLKKEPGTKVSREPEWNPERLRQIGVHALTGPVQGTVGACDLSDARSFLDLGGGHGFYSIAMAQKYPKLDVTLFDLPQVIPLARQLAAQFGLAERISLISGNFMQDSLGTGYDAILCANILHSDKRDTVLAKVYTALCPGGTIIVRCRVADCPDSLANALTKLVWQVRGGKELFTQAEWQGFLTAHGFFQIRAVHQDGIHLTLTGRRA